MSRLRRGQIAGQDGADRRGSMTARLRRGADIDPFSRAAVLAVDGRIDEAIAAWRRLALDPAARPAALARLAILQPSAVTDCEFAAMRADATLASGEAAMVLNFALGAVLE